MSTDTTEELLTFEDVSSRMVGHAARYVANLYGKYLVTHEDCKQEIYVWLYTEKGQRWVNQRLNSEPQKVANIRWKLRSVAKQYAEKQKAEKVGYDVEDIHWYTSTQVAALMPLALDDTYAGSGTLDYGEAQERPRDVRRGTKILSEGGEVQAMVLDVRRAIAGLPEWVEAVLRDREPTDALYDSAVQAVLSHLGGSREFVGKRKILSNTEALAKTGENYG